jgi:hypothetical protein
MSKGGSISAISRGDDVIAVDLLNVLDDKKSELRVGIRKEALQKLSLAVFHEHKHSFSPKFQILPC